MKQTKSPFKWRHFEPAIILLCVRWYCRYQLSYRDLEEMMQERGLSVDHVTIFRWVQCYAPEINKRVRPHLRMRGTSYRLDETYVKVGTEWEYLYRAVDSAGYTIEFMLGAKRDVAAAKRFFKKLMRADHRRLPFTIGTDKQTSYPEAFAASVNEKVLPRDCKLIANRNSPRKWLYFRHDQDKQLGFLGVMHNVSSEVDSVPGHDSRHSPHFASLFSITNVTRPLPT